ncbi:hypothetical protein ILP97_43300 [Amycolatopsis sp. H6(2020)]|nr:hypothetical protein [Amycolatopsis sp. H6(2020)]
METASTVFRPLAEAEQAQDVLDVRLGEGRCGHRAGIQVAQRKRSSLAVAAAFQDRHITVGVAAY